MNHPTILFHYAKSEADLAEQFRTVLAPAAVEVLCLELGATDVEYLRTIKQAHLVVPLVGPEYFKEKGRLEDMIGRGLRLFWVLARPCLFKQTILGGIHPANDIDKPLSLLFEEKGRWESEIAALCCEALRMVSDIRASIPGPIRKHAELDQHVLVYHRNAPWFSILPKSEITDSNSPGSLEKAWLAHYQRLASPSPLLRELFELLDFSTEYDENAIISFFQNCGYNYNRLNDERIIERIHLMPYLNGWTSKTKLGRDWRGGKHHLNNPADLLGDPPT